MSYELADPEEEAARRRRSKTFIDFYKSNTGTLSLLASHDPKAFVQELCWSGALGGDVELRCELERLAADEVYRRQQRMYRAENESPGRRIGGVGLNSDRELVFVDVRIYRGDVDTFDVKAVWQFAKKHEGREPEIEKPQPEPEKEVKLCQLTDMPGFKWPR